MGIWHFLLYRSTLQWGQWDFSWVQNVFLNERWPQHKARFPLFHGSHFIRSMKILAWFNLCFSIKVYLKHTLWNARWWLGPTYPCSWTMNQSVNHYHPTHSLPTRHTHQIWFYLYSPVQAVSRRVSHMGLLISTGNQHKPLQEDKEELPKTSVRKKWKKPCEEQLSSILAPYGWLVMSLSLRKA